MAALLKLDVISRRMFPRINIELVICISHPWLKDLRDYSLITKRIISLLHVRAKLNVWETTEEFNTKAN